MSTFKNLFLKLLDEDGNVAGSGGVLGSWDSSQFSGDTYAPGDYRRPFALGAVQKRNNTKKRKKKSKKK